MTPEDVRLGMIRHLLLLHLHCPAPQPRQWELPVVQRLNALNPLHAGVLEPQTKTLRRKPTIQTPNWRQARHLNPQFVYRLAGPGIANSQPLALP